jgi:RNA polymerase sigma-70 factor (ECF subfamily)
MSSTADSSSEQDFKQRLLAELDALYRTARYLTGDPALAEDIVQEVSLKAIQSQHTFRRGANFRPWIFAILRHTLTDYYRYEHTHPAPISLALDDPEMSTPGPSSDSHIFKYVLDEEIEQALNKLPDEMRLAVLLADIEEFSYREIAETLAWPLGSVMSRLHRGRQKLRHYLRAYARSRGYQP